MTIQIKYSKLLWILLVYFMVMSDVNSQSTHNILFKDLDADGDPDVAIIEANFYSDEDIILVYDKGDDMKYSQEWEKCCNFINDVWVFDAYGDNKTELIIDFNKKRHKIIAELYDDVNKDGSVSYFYNSSDFLINESSFPTLTVIAEDGYWSRDGKINFNLEMLGDGAVDIGQVYYPAIFKPNDGVADFKITIYDDDRDGDPDYELRENLGASGHSMLMVDFDDNETEWKNHIFWPYLGNGPGWWERGHNSASPPILIDWKKARISTVQLTVSDRYDDGNCFILTQDKIYRNKSNELSFENPFCFYDIANDDDGYQEAVLRVVNSPDKRDAVDIRYSWDQNNDGKYDFSVRAAGKPKYKLGDKYVSIVDFKDFSVVTIPFEKGPYWAFERKWDSVVFTDTNGLYWLGEGVYGNMFKREVNYTLGNIVVTTTRYVAGQNYHRVESFQRKSQSVALYMSPIDGKLHLKNAMAGTFTLKAKKTGNWYGSIFSREDIRAGKFTVYENIDYENLDGDGYIDRWTYYVNDTFVRGLVYLKDVLIYYDRSKVKLLKKAIDPYVFETTPPKNYEEWRNLQENLNKYRKEFDPRDLEGMFNQFQGEPITIEGGFIRNFSLTDSGFRVYLDCVPMCVVEPSGAVEHEGPVRAGKYVLEYDGGFKIIKSILPDLVIGEFDVTLSNETPREIEYIKLSAKVHNKGNEDVGPVVINFFEGKPDKGRLIGNQTIPFISPGGSSSVDQRWLAKSGIEGIYVVIDPENLIFESNEENNVVLKKISVISLKTPSVSERVVVGSEKTALKIAFAMVLGMLFLTIYISNSVLKD